MPPDPDKRQLRQLKRKIKRAGTKQARRALKQNLAEDPENAAEATVDYGNLSSASFNGLDRDSTRRAN
jgi:hypothetical protein